MNDINGLSGETLRLAFEYRLVIRPNLLNTGWIVGRWRSIGFDGTIKIHQQTITDNTDLETAIYSSIKKAKQLFDNGDKTTNE